MNKLRPSNGGRGSTCLAIYHPKDKSEARCMQQILKTAGYECKMFFDCSGPDFMTEIFRLTDSADCIISLITSQLVDDPKQFMYHRKVYQRHGGQRFIPVILDISESRMETDVNLGFMEGCRTLNASSWSDMSFVEDLVNLVKATLASQKNGWVTKNNRTTSVSCVESSRKQLQQSALHRKATSKVGQQRAVRRLGPLPSRAMRLRPSTLCRARHTRSPLKDLQNVPTCKSSDPMDVEDSRCVILEQTTSCCYQETEIESTVGETAVLPTVVPAIGDIIDQKASIQNDKWNESAQRVTTCSQIGGEKSPIQEENKDPLLGTGSSSEVHLRDYALSDGRIIQVAHTILHTRDTSIFHFDTEKARTLRYPFLLPTLEVTDRPGERCQLITPYMENGSLEAILNSKGSITWISLTTDVRSRFLVIIYQVCQAVAMLHNNLIVHGAISPRNILLDEFWNARLALDYGQSASINHTNEENNMESEFQAHVGYLDSYLEPTGPKSFHADILSLGITLLKMLLYRPSFDEYRATDGRLKQLLMSLSQSLHQSLYSTVSAAVADDLLADERYIDKNVWPSDKISRDIVISTLNFLSPSEPIRKDALVNIIDLAKEAVLRHARLTLLTLPQDRCVYCYVENRNRDLQLKAQCCTPECIFLNMCHTCRMCAFSHGPIVCPNHCGYIHAPIGGQQACALIISGRDNNDPGAQENFYNDAKAMERVVEHPRIVCIPQNNVFRISPNENCTSESIRGVMGKIVALKPDFFLLFYSGHNNEESTQLDVSDSQENSLDIVEIRRALMDPLWKYSSRVLIILDCCCAASLDLLPVPAPDSTDSYIRWYVKWSSCGRIEDSTVEAYAACSLFSTLVLAGLTGARRCPNGFSDCAVCRSFGETCRRRKMIAFEALSEFVREHMKRRHRDHRDDVQNPRQQANCGEEAIIAYFTDEPLYTFGVELPNEPIGGEPCCLDTLGDSVEDILRQLWNSLNVQGRLPNHIDHRAMQICRRTGNKSTPLKFVSEIIDIVHDDKNALFVTIRTDGKELAVDNWVVWFGERRTAERLMKTLSPPKSRNTCATVRTSDGEATVWQLDELRPFARPVGPFGAVLIGCWQKYRRLRQAKVVAAADRMRVEIYDGLTIFSIEVA